MAPPRLTLDDIARHLNILLSRHEDEDVADAAAEMDGQHLLHGRIDKVLARRLGKEHVDGKRAAGDRVVGRIAVEGGELADADQRAA
jgi:hypothetical protein